jgi:NTE family protein
MLLRLKILSVLLLQFWIANDTFTQSPVKTRPKIGVVLSGGGAKGLAHIGVLKVLEEAGIPVDFIAGTSMGAIVGGLYAIGYTARQLDSIARTTNWDEFLTDKVSRRNLSMIEKDESVKYFISFPIREKRISLPSGIVAGQNISRLFNQLTSSVYNQTDFSKFPIPYFCVATDVEKGESVVLKKGNLAEAMRASMAIPTVFTPEEIDGKALLDGGLVNNFPVEEMKKMGADIIIGVDVGFRYYKRNELNSLVKIIEQSIFMHSMEQNQKSKEMCNILITPALLDYNATSFNHADSLLVRGERAARAQIDKISELGRYIKSFPDSTFHPGQRVKNISRFYVKEIQIEGLSDVPQEFIERKLPFETPDTVEVADIDQFVEQIYGTRFFERISYNLEPLDGGVKLHFKVIEKSTNYFRVGLHYDPDFKTTIMLNTTFRNQVFRGSKITLDVALGENPSFTGLLYRNTGWNPKYNFMLRSRLVPDFGLKVQAHKIGIYEYQFDKRVSSYDFRDVTTDLFLQANLSNNDVLGLGAMGDYTSIKNNFITSDSQETSSYHANFYLFYKNDSYDQPFYPKRGSRIFTEVKYVKGLSEKVESQNGFFVASLRSNIVFPITNQISVSQSFFAGTTMGDTIPAHYKFLVGGMGGTYLRGLIPFVGMNFMQRTNNHVWVERLDFQWEMWNDNYLIFRINIGKTTYQLSDLWAWNDIVFGYGISYGYRSPIGPMEFSLMASNKNPGISTFINIGFWF